LRLPRGLVASVVCSIAAERKVLVLDGSDCFPDRYRIAALRLSFSYESPERIATGVARLAEVIRMLSR